ncbi:MAG: hydroxymethylglutaryl-CoA lyase [Bacteroidota bacterium]
MKIIESPREGMQGLERFIPFQHKVEYINALLKVGFDTVEVGSSVSPKAVPQMSDSMEVLDRLDFSTSRSKLMMLVVNKKGADLAACRDEISCISYPFSFSPGFLSRNMNTTYDGALRMTDYLLQLCSQKNKSLILYISMAFGNPYGEEWNHELLISAVEQVQKMGVRSIPLSNVSVPVLKETVGEVFSTLIHDFPCVEFGLHLHTSGEGWHEIVDAAYSQGCRRFDSVIGGLGGCPMAGNKMLGNLKTDNLVEFAAQNQDLKEMDLAALAYAGGLAKKYLF